MSICRPVKLHQKKYVEKTWIFRPVKLRQKKYVETTCISRPAKFRRKRYVEMTRKFVAILSSVYRHNIGVESTSVQLGVPVGMFVLTVQMDIIGICFLISILIFETKEKIKKDKKDDLNRRCKLMLNAFLFYLIILFCLLF